MTGNTAEKRCFALTGKKICRLVLILLAAGILAAAYPASADGEWLKCELPAKGTLTSPFMYYWVYTPENIKPGLPLVVYLHSSAGMINSALRESECGLPSLIISGDVPAPEAIVLVPQHPGLFEDTWSTVLSSVIACVDKVADEYEVDRSRIALTGFSLGGIGMWDLVVAKPGVYSRLLCIDGRVNKLSQRAELFEGCEVRVFTAHRDLAINTVTSLRFVRKLTEAGIQATYTELESTHQELPKTIYTDPAIQEWLWLRSPEKAPDPAANPAR